MTDHRHFQPNPYLHIYSVGDLDDFFWPYTTWYALGDDDRIQAIALMYTGIKPPNLIALSDELEPIQALLRSIAHLLPRQFYAHLSPGVEAALSPSFRLTGHGEHFKIALTDPDKVTEVDVNAAAQLTVQDEAALRTLYANSYPGNWFDPRMLETNQYFGVWQENRLVSVAGIHVYSPDYNVAALGNITSHPDWREKGLGRLVTARLCQSLLETVDAIGLNVKAANQTAVRLYRQLGFEVVASYGEYAVETR